MFKVIGALGGLCLLNSTKPKVFAKVREDLADIAAARKGNATQTGFCPPPKRGPCCVPPSQCNVVSCPKAHSLYLWINLNKEAEPGAVAKVAADMESLVESVTGPCEDPCDEVIAGVGFGPNFYCKVNGKTCKNYNYTYRKAPEGHLTHTEGDIILHAKCNNQGKLFELAKNYLCSLPTGSVAEFEDVYGFDYRCSRDLSGFMINRSNRCDEQGQRDVAVECQSGGSYALAMKWVHRFNKLQPDNKTQLEKIIGREMECGKELKCKGQSSHVARMTGTTEADPQPYCEVVRHSMPYGELSTEAGKFYLAFANDPCAHEFMLDQMVGAGIDGCCDDVLKLSENTKGAYFYFPSLPELCQMINPSAA